ncbi:MAG: peptide chain release factor 1 [Firmicutes bacterium]|nr:peptide chain release factor 1 [Bacillota bacterium]
MNEFSKIAQSIEQQLATIDAELSSGKPDVDFVALGKEHKRLSDILGKYGEYRTMIDDLSVAKSLNMNDEILALEANIDVTRGVLGALLRPRDPKDDANVIMEIRPAAGGDEAALFAGSLFKMYSGYATKCGFTIEIIDISENDIGGIKEVNFMVNGHGAFEKFKYESGVHRVQRVPDTESQGRIHTSTCTVAVLPEAVTIDFKIDEKDLRVDVYRSSGAGGQHVNKTESAVRITHLPTNTVVTCQDGRSQIKNRETAMRVLQSKLVEHFQSEEDKKYATERKSQVGSGDRSERIRTYNFPQDRVTDHRVGATVHNLPVFMTGEISELLDIVSQKLNSN